MRLARLLIAPALVLASSLAAATRPTIAVLPFTVDKQVVVATANVVITGIAEGQTSVLTDELVHQLVASRKFDVLERRRVDDLITEKQFQESDYASPDEAPKIAKLLGADYFVLGRIDDATFATSQKAIPYSSQVTVQQEARLKVYLRIVDARTGRIVAAEKINQEATLRLPGKNDKKGETIGSKLVATAAATMVSRITDSVFPLRVARVEGRALYLNRGEESSGLKLGDMLVVLSQGAEIIDSDTRESLGHTEEAVARARVTGVQARFVKAELDGEGTVQSGMLVRKAEAAPATPAAPAADAPTGPRW